MEGEGVFNRRAADFLLLAYSCIWDLVAASRVQLLDGSEMDYFNSISYLETEVILQVESSH